MNFNSERTVTGMNDIMANVALAFVTVAAVSAATQTKTMDDKHS